MKNVFIENDISSFEDFHDKEWFAKLFALVDGSRLEEIADDFGAHWWGASRSFVLPWLCVTGVYDAVDSTVPILDKSKQDLWDEYLKNNAFKASLWKVAEGSFCAIYYAYENLLVRLLAEITGRPIRVTERGFNKQLITVYGPSADRVWSSNFVAVSREIRNCITHNGGKATERLLTMKPRPVVERGDVLISANDVRTLYNGLKPCVLEAIVQSLRTIGEGTC